MKVLWLNWRRKQYQAMKVTVMVMVTLNF